MKQKIHPFLKDDHTQDLFFPYSIALGIYVGVYLIAVLQGIKIIELFGLVFPGGYFAASFTYPCTDIVGEVYGRKYARKLVTCGLITMAVALFVIQVDLLLPAASIWKFEQSYNDIFGFSSRLILAGFLAYIAGQYADVYIFSYIRRLTKGKWLFLRNNGSTAISKIFDVLTFNFVGFYGVYELNELIIFSFSAYIFYLVIAILDTPFVYLAVWWIRKKYPVRQGYED